MQASDQLKRLGRPEQLQETVEEISALEAYLGAGSMKKPVNHANYTKENYNILTLQEHDPYYKKYHNRIPVYVREKPDWTKSLYRKKNTKVTKYNYILFRNAKDLRQKTASQYGQSTVPRSALYNRVNRRAENRSFAAGESRMETSSKRQDTLPLILKKEPSKGRTLSKAEELRKRSLSSYCASKTQKKSLNSTVSGVRPHLTETEKLIKRAEQLGHFVQGLGAEGTKQIATEYAKRLLEKMKASNLTKEQMKIALSGPMEEVTKIIEKALAECGEEVPQDPEKKEEEGKKEGEKPLGEEPETKQEYVK